MIYLFLSVCTQAYGKDTLYLSTLYFAKKIKRLLTKNVNIEYWRSYKWYARKLSQLGVQIVNFNSANIFLIDFLPKSLYSQLQRLEIKYYKGKFLKNLVQTIKLKQKLKKQRKFHRHLLIAKQSYD